MCWRCARRICLEVYGWREPDGGAPVAGVVALAATAANNLTPVRSLGGCCCLPAHVRCMQALRSRQLLHSSGSGAPKASRRGGGSSMHTMLTLQLDSYQADGSALQRNTLSFVELAAPEPKVRFVESVDSVSRFDAIVCCLGVRVPAAAECNRSEVVHYGVCAITLLLSRTCIGTRPKCHCCCCSPVHRLLHICRTP
jgi:hypothetical protein